MKEKFEYADRHLPCFPGYFCSGKRDKWRFVFFALPGPAKLSISSIVAHCGPGTLKSGKMHQGNQTNRPDFSLYGTQ